MKYCGYIGFSETKETEEGIWEEIITEKFYHGDILNPGYKTENSENVNDNYRITNRISVVIDTYLYAHYHILKYVELYGVKWEVRSASLNEKRLVISLGGVYNVEQT